MNHWIEVGILNIQKPSEEDAQEERRRFLEHLQWASDKVRTWPVWKQRLLGWIPDSEAKRERYQYSKTKDINESLD